MHYQCFCQEKADGDSKAKQRNSPSNNPDRGATAEDSVDLVWFSRRLSAVLRSFSSELSKIFITGAIISGSCRMSVLETVSKFVDLSLPRSRHVGILDECALRFGISVGFSLVGRRSDHNVSIVRSSVLKVRRRQQQFKYPSCWLISLEARLPRV